MINNSVDTHLLILAITAISLALVFYSFGVWGEKLQHRLKKWHVILFLLGLVADAIGTSVMAHISKITHTHDTLHAVTGFTAIILMFIHATWAVWIYNAGSEAAKEKFHKFSIFVWCMWMIPYLIGVYMGMFLHQ